MKTPYFWKGKRDFQLDEVLDILHLSVDGNRICLERPLGVNEDASFVIDTIDVIDEITWRTTLVVTVIKGTVEKYSL